MPDMGFPDVGPDALPLPPTDCDGIAELPSAFAPGVCGQADMFV